MNREAQASVLLLLGGALVHAGATDLYLRYVKAELRPLLLAAGVGSAHCHRRDRREMRILSTGRDGCATPVTHVSILRGVGRGADVGGVRWSV